MRFSYSGTTPATIVQFTVVPDFGNWTNTHKWKSPSIQAAAKEDHFALDKGIVQRFHSLHLSALPAGDRSALLIFLEAVDGIANTFDYTDSAGVYWTARIWNAKELKSTLVSFNRSEITIELLVTAHPNLIVNGSLWTGASGATPPNSWTAINSGTYGITSGYLSIQKNATNFPGITQSIAVTLGHTYVAAAMGYLSASGTARINIGTSSMDGSLGALSFTGLTSIADTSTFVATADTIYLSPYLATATPPAIAYFDNVEMIDAGF